MPAAARCLSEEYSMKTHGPLVETLWKQRAGMEGGRPFDCNSPSGAYLPENGPESILRSHKAGWGVFLLSPDGNCGKLRGVPPVTLIPPISRLLPCCAAYSSAC